MQWSQTFLINSYAIQSNLRKINLQITSKTWIDG